MRLDRYLVVSSSRRCRITKKKPALESDEVLISLCLELPDALFKKPIVQARVQIGDGAVTPAEISAEVLLNTKELIERGTGLRVELVPVVLQENRPVNQEGP